MTLNHRLGLVLFATVLTAGSAAAQHQGHDAKAQTKPAANAKMAMPALNDAQFVEMMRKHHQDGIELARLEESKGTREQVKSLAAKIREGQENDLKEFDGHSAHASTGSATPAKPQGTSGHEGHDASMQKHHEMMEQMAKQSKDRVQNASGTQVDQAFVAEMTKHHEMALQMISKAKLQDPSLRKLAQKMSASQKRELQELKSAGAAR